MSEEDTQQEEQKMQSDPGMCCFAATRFRGSDRKFGIKLDDRRRHMYVIGKTGMGKTTMLENMMLNDIYAGHGVGIIDPHGDSAEKVIDYIPAHRLNDVVYFNPADMGYPFGFNILENIDPDHKHLIVAGLMGVFKKIWPDVWSARMEYILNNTLLALLDYPGSTLLGVNRLLADKSYRKKVISKIKDPIVRSFWVDEFAKYNERYQQEAIAPIQNKVGQFLSANIMRNIVAQVKSTINVREIMDSRKILIMNLSKGRIGEDNSRLLGGLLITKIQLSAMERVDIPENERKDFILYVDEFQNFASESFAHILSEARKYRLSLVMAHQFVEQLIEEVSAAVFGNVGTLVCFRVGSRDSESFAKEFEPEFTEEDLVKLEKFNIYLKLMVDGVATIPFSAKTLPPIAATTHSTEKVIRNSRERYAVTRQSIEEKIMKWSGMEIDEPSKPEEKKEEPDKKEDKPRVVPNNRKEAPPERSDRKDKKSYQSSSISTPRRSNSNNDGESKGVGEKKEQEKPAPKQQTNSSGLTTIQFGSLGRQSDDENDIKKEVPSSNVAGGPRSIQMGVVSKQSEEGSGSSEGGGAPAKKKRKRKRKKSGSSDSSSDNRPTLTESEPALVENAQAGNISLGSLKKQD